MRILKKILNEESKIRRRRRILLNMHITMVAWLIEFLGYFFGLLASFMLQDNKAMRASQIASSIIYFVVVPSSYLFNTTDIKEFLMNNDIYEKFTNAFFSKAVNVCTKEGEESEE